MGRRTGGGARANPTSYEASLVKLRVIWSTVSDLSHLFDPPGSVRGARGCVARSSRGVGRWCAGTPCRPPPIRAGLRRRSPHSACAMTSACSTLRTPHLRKRQRLAPACPGCVRGPCPRDGMRHAVWLSAFLLFCLSHFFGSTRAASLLPSRPQCARGAARRPRQGRLQGLALTRSSTVPGWRCRAVSPRRAHAETLVLSTAPSGTTPRSR